MSADTRFVLAFQCEDQPGIVAGVAGHFAAEQFNIVASSQYKDPVSNRFFMRTEYESLGSALVLDDVRTTFTPIAETYGMRWELVSSAERMRVVVAVSKMGHCLNRLLNAWQHRTIPIDIVAVVSNHETLRSFVEWHDVDYHHLPITPETKPQQEAQLLDIVSRERADLLVLARYMQVLSDETCQRLDGRAINIHHSFLPGFKGARPYHRAYEKGVKLMGATAHYVTSDLDEGPIIEQDVMRVTHAQTPSELVEIGRDVEAAVLHRAVAWHAERRVVINGKKTVVFGR
ncbi:MAG: formyltetrahydrofolate deformylase [Pseudomonadota bacterium]